MREIKSIDFVFYKLHVDGSYEYFDTPFDTIEFDFGKPFYIVTDKDYIDHTIEEETLNHFLDNLKEKEVIQIIYCPPKESQIEAIYIMFPDIQIAGVFSTCESEDENTKGQKQTNHFFPSDKETQLFIEDELKEVILKNIKSI